MVKSVPISFLPVTRFHDVVAFRRPALLASDSLNSEALAGCFLKSRSAPVWLQGMTQQHRCAMVLRKCKLEDRGPNAPFAISIFPGAGLGFGKDLQSSLNMVFPFHTWTVTPEEPSIAQFEPMAPIGGANGDAVRRRLGASSQHLASSIQ